MTLQRLRHAQRARADPFAADAMGAEGDDFRLWRLEQLAGEDLAEKAGDHSAIGDAHAGLKQIERRADRVRPLEFATEANYKGAKNRVPPVSISCRGQP